MTILNMCSINLWNKKESLLRASIFCEHRRIVQFSVQTKSMRRVFTQFAHLSMLLIQIYNWFLIWYLKVKNCFIAPKIWHLFFLLQFYFFLGDKDLNNESHIILGTSIAAACLCIIGIMLCFGYWKIKRSGIVCFYSFSLSLSFFFILPYVLVHRQDIACLLRR